MVGSWFAAAKAALHRVLMRLAAVRAFLGYGRSDGEAGPEVVVISKDGFIGTNDVSNLSGLLQHRLLQRRKRNIFVVVQIFIGTFALLALAYVIIQSWKYLTTKV